MSIGNTVGIYSSSYQKMATCKKCNDDLHRPFDPYQLSTPRCQACGNRIRHRHRQTLRNDCCLHKLMTRWYDEWTQLCRHCAFTVIPWIVVVCAKPNDRSINLGLCPRGVENRSLYCKSQTRLHIYCPRAAFCIARYVCWPPPQEMIDRAWHVDRKYRRNL